MKEDSLLPNMWHRGGGRLRPGPRVWCRAGAWWCRSLAGSHGGHGRAACLLPWKQEVGLPGLSPPTGHQLFFLFVCFNNSFIEV